jgi:hypothetical protein
MIVLGVAEIMYAVHIHTVGNTYSANASSNSFSVHALVDVYVHVQMSLVGLRSSDFDGYHHHSSDSS